MGGHISLALILTIVLQSAAALLWAGAAAERINQLERRTADQDGVSERLARLEEQVGQARASLNRIEKRLER
ncbi:MAG: hypothetical protein COA84_03895 [Robiginitomaculum sp.]|nr:MAG: hypothetical protein COA84_03895 [Robiginitomaculum sp.]